MSCCVWLVFLGICAHPGVGATPGYGRWVCSPGDMVPPLLGAGGVLELLLSPCVLPCRQAGLSHVSRGQAPDPFLAPNSSLSPGASDTLPQGRRGLSPPVHRFGG